MGYIRIDLKADARKRAAAIITTVFFIASVAGLGIVSLILERPTVSETENRELETFPEFSLKSYLSGAFAEQLDKYFTDTVPFRDTLNEYAAVLENAKGIPSPQFYGVEIVNNEPEEIIDSIEPDTLTEPVLPQDNGNDGRTVIAADEIASVPAETAVPSEISEAAETAVSEVSAAETSQSADDEEFTGDISDFLNNGILVNGVDMYGEKAGIMLFGGNDKQGQRYADIISAYKRELGDGVNVYNMVVPTSVEFYLPKKYAKFSNSEKREIDFIYSKLTDGVIPVDAYSALEAHKDEYIYFRTDHHWTDLGAYYAYTAFCEAIGQTAPALSDYTVKTKDELFVGSLFGYTGNIILKNNPDTFTYYMTNSDFKGETYEYRTLSLSGANPIYHQYASGSNMYGMFLGGDGYHVKITTSAGTGRKIVMFKESYGNAFAPYLIDSFDEIYVIDIRYFGRNALQYIKDVGATDVLFINNVFAANTSKLIDGIERLFVSPTGTVVYTAPPETETVSSDMSDTVSQTGLPVGQVSQSQVTQITQITQTVPPAQTSQVLQTEQQVQQVQQTQQVTVQTTAQTAQTAPPVSETATTTASPAVRQPAVTSPSGETPPAE
ncbi:MAG: DHHW family protein [Prevotella sp.]|nr:DHHW family protein [Prevotella sp.]